MTHFLFGFGTLLLFQYLFCFFFFLVVRGRFVISGNCFSITLLLKGSKVRFMDTMSLHMAISGLTGFQRTLWMACKLGKKRGLQDVKEHIKKARHKKDGPVVCAHPVSLQYVYSKYFLFELVALLNLTHCLCV